MRSLVIALVLCGVAIGAARSEQHAPLPESTADASGKLGAALPDFLPAYYARALTGLGPITLTLHDDKNNVSRYVYATDDQVISVSIEHYSCDDASCPVIYQNAAKYLDKQVTDNGGIFLDANPTDFRVQWKTGLAENDAMVARLPSALLFWTYSSRLERSLDLDGYFDAVASAIERQRYEEAAADGNVVMGRWREQIRGYAHRLLHQGRKDEAISVLKALLATAPSDYESHVDFMANTTDAAAAQRSAEIVFENAERPDLVTTAARFLGRTEPNLDSVAILAKGETGLQLILIPLPPVDLGTVIEAAKIYETITGVPTKIRRLAEPWDFGAPQRIFDQKRVQAAIIQHDGPAIDFSAWTLDRYVAALLQTVAADSALSKYSMRDYVKKIETGPGQFLIDPVLVRFNEMLADYRSKDARTMYVGVTSADIYSGDYNYVFSQFAKRDLLGTSILSYNRMTASASGATFQSRKRLTERIAKELVPASLKALDIARPADPSDPYSYADGLERLDQKSLTLSAPVREALDKFR
jgi:hypothetical protein